MKYGVIDIGSNSVRLMLSDGEKTIAKFVNTTRLADGLSSSGKLKEISMKKSAEAVVTYYLYAVNNGCDEVYCFATEAVRNASNRQDFVDMLQDNDISIDIIASQEEALIGFGGAYIGGKCCVVDIGGASAEIAVGDEHGIIYARSLPIGLVRIMNMCGENLQAISEYIQSIIVDYGEVPKFDTLIGIGGAATTYAAIVRRMQVYDSNLIHRQVIRRDEIEKSAMSIATMDMEERKNVAGLSSSRRDTIVGGGMLLVAIMDYLKCNSIMISESDNLEGYLMRKLNKTANKK